MEEGNKKLQRMNEEMLVVSFGVIFLLLCFKFKTLYCCLAKRLFTSPQLMGFWKFSQEGGQRLWKSRWEGAGVELEKVFCRGHFDR